MLSDDYCAPLPLNHSEVSLGDVFLILACVLLYRLLSFEVPGTGPRWSTQAIAQFFSFMKPPLISPDRIDPCICLFRFQLGQNSVVVFLMWLRILGFLFFFFSLHGVRRPSIFFLFYLTGIKLRIYHLDRMKCFISRICQPLLALS